MWCAQNDRRAVRPEKKKKGKKFLEIERELCRERAAASQPK
jgi:hypothetical protein